MIDIPVWQKKSSGEVLPYEFYEAYEFEGWRIDLYRLECEKGNCPVIEAMPISDWPNAVYGEGRYVETGDLIPPYWEHENISPNKLLNLCVEEIVSLTVYDEYEKRGYDDNNWPTGEVQGEIERRLKGAIVLSSLLRKRKGSQKVKTKRKRDSLLLQYWAALVKHRDGYKCTQCKSEVELHAHHIKQYKDHPELRLDLNNGLTLCANCHRKHHKENGR